MVVLGLWLGIGQDKVKIQGKSQSKVQCKGWVRVGVIRNGLGLGYVKQQDQGQCQDNAQTYDLGQVQGYVCGQGCVSGWEFGLE